MSGDALRGMLAPPPVRAALEVVVLTCMTAVPVAGAWFRLAPPPRWQVAATGVFNVGGDSEVFIAADAWFAMCGAAAGAICAIVAFLVVRGVSPLILLALTVGGAAGSVGAWRLGILFGPAAIDVQAKALSLGDQFDGPLELSALGVLVAWPLASVAVYFSLVAGLVEPVRGDSDAVFASQPTAGIDRGSDAGMPSGPPSGSRGAGGRWTRARGRRGLRR